MKAVEEQHRRGQLPSAVIVKQCTPVNRPPGPTPCSYVPPNGTVHEPAAKVGFTEACQAQLGRLHHLNHAGTSLRTPFAPMSGSQRLMVSHWLSDGTHEKPQMAVWLNGNSKAALNVSSCSRVAFSSATRGLSSSTGKLTSIAGSVVTTYPPGKRFSEYSFASNAPGGTKCCEVAAFLQLRNAAESALEAA
eukprot:4532498-Prymnesium_polylepis.3